MITPPNPVIKYQVGGCLSEDAPSYVERQADQDFFKNLKAGEFCYVLNSRQMGKSSLRVRTMKKLQKEKIACTAIEMRTLCETDIKAQDFYGSFRYLLVKDIYPEFKSKLPDWLKKYTEVNPLKKLQLFLEDELLPNVKQKIVIFLDEIDSLIDLQFKDDFFAFIRECYNKRADNAEYQRLTFALLGVATPYELINDTNKTPFNIGKQIELTGFQLQETKVLQQVLAGKVSESETVLQYILEWTGGQPFLTQKLCELILSRASEIQNVSLEELKIFIKNLVKSDVIENWQDHDDQEHLKTIENYVLKRSNAQELLKIYQDILNDKMEVKYENDKKEHMQMRLSGLVVKKDGQLKTYNLIYRAVFSKTWVTRELLKLSPKPKPVVETERQILSPKLEHYKIYEALKEGDFCYILSSPMPEKEIFLEQIKEALKDDNISFVVVDAKKIEDVSSGRKAEDFEWWSRGQWYQSIAKIIEKDFKLKYPATTWWQRHFTEDENQKQQLLTTYIEHNLLNHENQKSIVIIFNSIIEDNHKCKSLFEKLNFQDEVFGFIRSCYEKRSLNENYKRLTFMILDVAVNPELTNYKKVAPITVAWRINLGSELELETKPILIKGLKEEFGNLNSQIVLERIWYWTSGHPLLNQKFLQIAILNKGTIKIGQEQKYIDNFVNNMIKFCIQK